MYCAHLRRQLLFDEGCEFSEQRVGIVAGQMTELEIERAFLRHDIERSSTSNDARVHRGMRDIETPVIRSMIAIPPRHRFQECNRFRRSLDRIHTGRCIRRMTRVAADKAAKTFFAL